MSDAEPSPGPPAEPAPGPAPSGSAGSVIARVGGGVALVGASLWILRPFLVPAAWAAIAAYVTWPVLRALRRRTGRPAWAATLCTVGVAIGVGLPVAWVLVALAGEASHLVGSVRSWLDLGAPPPGWIGAHPEIREGLDHLGRIAGVQPAEAVRFATRQAGIVTGRLVQLAGGLAANVLRFVVMLVTLFVFYLEGEHLIGHARRLARIAFPHAPASFLDDVGGVVRAVVFGLLGTALVQGLVAGIGFALFGVPSPVALGALTVLGSFVPMGPVVLWGGGAVWLFFAAHRTSAAIGMLLYGALGVSSIDNVLRPLLISRSPTRIHFLVILFGVLGGLTAFGLLGLFLGPVLLSVTIALALEFGRRGEAVGGG
jgi:predicted PurR-regulated permease PerM